MIEQLRIGNLVSDGKRAMRVFEILRHGVLCRSIGLRNFECVILDKDIEGIPLNKENLLLSGFKLVNSNIPLLLRMKSFDGHKRFRFDSLGGMAIETVMSGFVWYLPHIKYMNQFQNLHLDITGQEVKFKATHKLFTE